MKLLALVSLLCYLSCRVSADNEFKGLHVFEFNNSTYEVIDAYVTWYEANYACKLFGMFLVSVETEEEDAALRQAIVDYVADDFWTSGNNLFDLGHFYWDTTGRALGPFTNWAENHPDGGAQNCISLNGSFGHKWTDRFCSNSARFICEKAPCS
ncbi:C-type lectin domain family 3 member A-like [Neocloeon triangulifer]|uniref:C-type lectin domain family 3 member A-like n=1 Tax=Neocloeon triangulifer TaxID=2078957 RepID=UPI00286F69F9|nr:C-type lectin domain family 3 member A-like [Neocloeon triangulifer]